ncbi:MAG: four helix bundle protein [Candidatus Promineifilaceae bacterium]
MQELEESSYWMELLIEGNLVSEKKLAALLQEADELMAILVTMVRKVKSK